MGGTESTTVYDEAPTRRQQDPDYFSQYESGTHYVMDRDRERSPRLARVGNASAEGCPPMTVTELFEQAAERKSGQCVLRVERTERGHPPEGAEKAAWKTWTWGEYFKETTIVAKALLALGLHGRDAVCVYGFNSPEWLMACIGAICAGGVVVGIYPTDTEDQVQFKAAHSRSVVAVVQGAKQTNMFEALSRGGKLPALKAVVYWTPDGQGDRTRSFTNADGNEVVVLFWADLKAKDTPDNVYTAAKRRQDPGHVCALIYTSGTTGSPKAAMISHDNLHFMAWSLRDLVGGVEALAGEHRLLSYLPLSHVAGMLIDVVVPIVIAAKAGGHADVYFARPTDLKDGGLAHRLRACRPTIFLGVPRVWEKIELQIRAAAAENPPGPVKRYIIAKAKRDGTAYANARQLGGSGQSPGCYTFPTNKSVYGKLAARLGLDACVMAITGAAPIRTETLAFFAQFGVHINDWYGMSECTGATIASSNAAHLWGSCGYALEGMEVAVMRETHHGSGRYERVKECPPGMLLDPNMPEKYQGELCFRGRHIMMGYLANDDLGAAHVQEVKKKNEESIDEWGWLHSGDKGAQDTRGMLRVTGRYKEMIITAGGENVAPLPIEASIVQRFRGGVGLSNVIMIGDKRKFNVCLITLENEGANGESPGSDRLGSGAIGVSPSATTVQQAFDDEAWISEITRAITATNADGTVAPSNAAKVQKFSILPVNFSVSGGELTPTLKLRRSFVERKYTALLDRMYSDQCSKDIYIRYDENFPASP
ncbi:Very long-chain-fatty-acid--CoA ligase bubblegum [Diplonema papillatum]|nr:Very long-chain-fatty-acid--CoA ligase bubblegum [Diplonema papillatum]